MIDQKHEELVRKLNLITIKEAAKDAMEYIDGRRRGTISILKTRWNKFNSQYGGIEWNSFMTFAGISGSGKSSIVNELETSLFDFNKYEKFVVLSFNYEMLSSRQVGRKISSKMNKSVSYIYSKQGILSKEEYDIAAKYANEVSDYKIYYSEMPSTVDGIEKIIEEFCEHFKDYGVIVMLDHSRLVRKSGSETENETLTDLATRFIRIKKKYKVSIILISQLNRNIESAERLLNPSAHYPIRSDLFASDAVYQCSDYVFVLHRPEILN